MKEYEQNPRKNETAVEAVAESIKEFGFKVPIVIDENKTIIAGHTRLKASKKLKLEKVPCIIASDLTEEQIKAYRLADNKVAEFSEWDFDLLTVELDDIIDIDMSLFGFDIEEEAETLPNENEHKSGSLAEDFVVPPLSVLDTRQGYWQERKRTWKELGIASEIGRKENLLGDGMTALGQKYNIKLNSAGTSVFDPVLCEIMYKWFNVIGGSIYDCFAGGSVRGIIAEKLGYKYTGIDLRQEQVDANIANAEQIGVQPKWHCDDSQNADKYLEDESVDMIFSCPPYADLEVYSDDERDISNMEYEDFKVVYKKIIETACRKLKENRFAVFVVGDVRDKSGAYRNFVDFTKECFNENGLVTYNELILLESISTACIKARRLFRNRKVAKVHQNVLVFYKGDLKKIKDNYDEIEVGEEVFEKTNLLNFEE